MLRPDIGAAGMYFPWLRGEQSVYVPSENRERNVLLIDFDHPDNNIFQVTDEWKPQGAAFTNRADASFSSTACPWPWSRARAPRRWVIGNKYHLNIAFIS